MIEVNVGFLMVRWRRGLGLKTKTKNTEKENYVNKREIGGKQKDKQRRKENNKGQKGRITTMTSRHSITRGSFGGHERVLFFSRVHATLHPAFRFFKSVEVI